MQIYVTIHAASVRFETLVVTQLRRNCLHFRLTQSDCPCEPLEYGPCLDSVLL